METLLTIIAFLLFAILRLLYIIGKQLVGYDEGDGRSRLTIAGNIQRLNKENLDRDEDEWRRSGRTQYADWMGRTP